MEKIGIFGGSFDPPHIGHINLAKAAIEGLSLDRLIIVPAGQPPHKAGAKAGGEDRLNMCRLAFKSLPQAEVSDYEVLMQGKSYTYKTLEHISGQFKGAKFYLIVGQDMLYDFPSWKEPERILQMCTLAAACRIFDSGYDLKEVDSFFSRFPDSVVHLDFDCTDVSSTAVRRLLSLGSDADGLVTKEVSSYLSRCKPYTDGRVEYVKNNVSQSRFEHIKGVIVMALKYCKAFNVQEEKAFFAALLHDSAKGRENGFDLSEYKDVPHEVVHQFLGAELVKNEVGITDREVIDAIKYHSTGRPCMTDLEKLLFVCDMLESGRDYEGVNYLRELLETDCEKCFLECIKYQYEYLLKKGGNIHQLTRLAYEYYINKE